MKDSEQFVKRNRELQDIIDDKEKKIEDLEKEQQDMKKKVKTMEAEKIQLTENLKLTQHQLQLCQNELASRQEEVDISKPLNFELSLEELESQNRKLKEDLELAKETLSAEIQNLRAENMRLLDNQGKDQEILQIVQEEARNLRELIEEYPFEDVNL